jgi:hypothetical protein
MAILRFLLKTVVLCAWVIAFMTLLQYGPYNFAENVQKEAEWVKSLLPFRSSAPAESEAVPSAPAEPAS